MKKFRNIFLSLLLASATVTPCLADPPEKPPNWIPIIMEKNPCFNDPMDRKLNIYDKENLGIMVHSTASPGVMAEEWYDLWNKSLAEGGREVGVHFFVDGKWIVQSLPVSRRSWHCGRGSRGSFNDTHISIEMCESSLVEYTDESHSTIKVFDPEHPEKGGYNPASPESVRYFAAALKNMVNLCAYLAQRYNTKTENIICHAEGFRQGKASNHKDVEHWWPLHGFNMDMFRHIVRDEIQGKSVKYEFNAEGKFIKYW